MSQNYDRREFLQLTAGATAAAAIAPWKRAFGATERAASPQPNILVFLTDDHGQWAQHAYGNSELLTPNFDRLAATGTRMTQAFATSPVCSPSRASFFTGRMPSQHGIHDWLEETKCAYVHPGLTGQTLISELLRDAGYHTGLVGKWHCGWERRPHPGFDRWFSYWESQRPHYGDQHFSDQGQYVEEHGQQSPLLTRRAIEFLREHRRQVATRERPFFLFVSYVDTHSPHKLAPPDLANRYQAARFNDIPSEPFPPCHGQTIRPVASSAEVERRNRIQYYAAVSSVDREVGKILDELESTGQRNNTLIVYTSDHGLNAGHHGMWEKGNATIPQNFFEESIRVPCTVSWIDGDVRRKATCDDFVNHCDLWATLLQAANAAPAEAVRQTINSPGRSYLAQLRGQAAANWRQAMICEYGNARMIRTREHKLIRRYPYEGQQFADELYDMTADPRETTNRFRDAAGSPLVAELTARLDDFFTKYTVAGRSGLTLDRQPLATPESPWLARRLSKSS